MSSSHQVAIRWSFRFNISPSNEHPGLIPFGFINCYNLFIDSFRYLRYITMYSENDNESDNENLCLVSNLKSKFSMFYLLLFNLLVAYLLHEIIWLGNFLFVYLLRISVLRECWTFWSFSCIYWEDHVLFLLLSVNANMVINIFNIKPPFLF